MARNVEIKARLANWDDTMSRALSLEPDHRESLVQTDTFFNVEFGRLKLRAFDDGTAELISYDRDDTSEAKLSSYLRTSCADPETMLQMLSDSIGIRGVVEKTRELILVGQTRIHFDQVSNLGKYLELEVVLRDAQSLEEGQVIADALMVKLGISKEDLVPCAYIDLLENQTHSA